MKKVIWVIWGSAAAIEIPFLCSREIVEKIVSVLHLKDVSDVSAAMKAILIQTTERSLLYRVCQKG